MCVNDLLAQGAEPLMFLDYYANGQARRGRRRRPWWPASPRAAARPTARSVGGETAEMPGMYAEGDYDMAGFCVGAVDRDKVLPRLGDQKPGDILVGLGSTARTPTAIPWSVASSSAPAWRGTRPRRSKMARPWRRPCSRRPASM